MKKKTIDKHKIYRECWNLDVSFFEWLLPRLVQYKKDASKIVNLEYHKFEYDGQMFTQLELIDMMINDLQVILNSTYDTWNGDIMFKEKRILNVWALVCLSMWW